ncbi:zinc finger protein 613-like isoform X2 [Periplaneta americana]|uniref:zinc finger protein 613-like isoform X2 n=1 Tax=Periplaneta americana TaxID=6978 RepID=UPI0037E79E99
MDAVTVDYTQSCRLCLSNQGIRIPIFVDEMNGTTDEMLPSKILTCVSIKEQVESSEVQESTMVNCTDKESPSITIGTGIDIIKIKQEPTDSSVNVDYDSNSEVVNHVYVKMEDQSNYLTESTGSEQTEASFISPQEQEVVDHDPQTEYTALVTGTHGLEIQPIYTEKCHAGPMPQLLVVAQKRKLRPRTPRNVPSVTLECPMCCCPFTYQAAYDKHRKICKKKVLQKQGNGLMCAICKVKFESQYALVCHERLHTKSRIKPREVTFSCDTCNIVFQQKGELICHQAQYHRAQVNRNIAQQKVFACDKCGLSFVHKGEYILHKEFHHTASRLTCRLPIYRAVAQAADGNNRS